MMAAKTWAWMAAFAAAVIAAAVMRSRPPGVDRTEPGGTSPPRATPSGVPAIPKIVLTKAIDLNVASVEDLETLPGITPDYARQIAAHRPYRSLDDITARAGVPRTVLDRVSPPATLVIKDGVPRP